MDIKTALFISQEIAPYLPETPASLLGRAVSTGIQEKGPEVRAFMPKYGCINERRNQLHEVIRLSGLNISIDDCDHPLIIKVATLQPSRMQVYFIDNDDYFHRTKDTETEIYSHPADNDERIIFFARGVIETVRKLRWAPSVINCMGWASALTPLYVRRRYNNDPTFRESKIVYTITDSPMPQPLDKNMPEKLRMDGFDDNDIKALTQDTQIDALTLSKLAIDFADAVIVATENAPEQLVEYAQKSGKPVAHISADNPDYIDRYHDFFTNL